MPTLDSDIHRDVSGTHEAGEITSPQSRPALIRFADYIVEEATFFRLHLIAFTLIPLIFSGIFYASNGRFHVKFLDSMFLCYSAMTVTGLSTVNLSTLTVFQQFNLYFLMIIGDVTFVSWIMVLVRKRFFRIHCEYTVTQSKNPRLYRSHSTVVKSISSPIATFKQQEPAIRQEQEKSMEGEDHSPGVQVIAPTPMGTMDVPPRQSFETEKPPDETHILTAVQTFSSSPRSPGTQLPPETEVHTQKPPTAIEFAMTTSVSSLSRAPVTSNSDGKSMTRDSRIVPRKNTTIFKNNKISDVPGSSDGVRAQKHKGFGGFPGPLNLLHRAIKHTAPRTYRKLERKMTMPTVTTLEASSVPWLNFSGLVVGRNSNFHTDSLTDEQLEDIGGTEYRALRLLSYLVPTYFVFSQLVALVLFLPWLSSISTYNSVFESQPRFVTKPWFSLFQVMGAYTGGGLSLVDLGMLPFQNAYPMLFALMFAILAGNHALPIFLRFIIWTLSKICAKDCETHETLSFLLDHPRRCFLYLFPSHQTWFLVICLILFNAIEWIASLVLNLGLPAYESIPVGQQVIGGLFQALATRASGFAVFPLATFAPALQFLYVVMMYIAVYPVALSIRSTNVYEERSLGIFEAPPDDEDEEPDDIRKLSSRRERVGRYLGWHLHRQMSIDIWWLVWAVFIIAIIERKNLLDESKKWFDLFRIIFELVSAFGGIGLSLGFPSDNFSFVGVMSPLSKLVVIVIMVRGRHRGLPVAVDRAVLLPNELVVRHESVWNKDEPK
ncbi:potassium transporter [Phlegmacium glaucopus]|nr:potassium transporter [Phlegmacium glaucopus]